ncbi:hypothetical protein [Nonomuraea sp. H19]|uniref:hypothetical protein n=1 Tax=Nonomuraea sp. H19 TaxID=3452206 RepID=UPI003F89C3C4
MSGLNVAHRRAGTNPEDADEVDGVGRDGGFVQQPILSDPVGVDADPPEDQRERIDTDGGVVAEGGRRGDEQMRIGTGGPALIPVLQPGGQQIVGEFIKVEGMPSVLSAQGERASGGVDAVEPQRRQVLGVQGVDGDDEPFDRGVDAVDEAAELIVGQWDRHAGDRGQNDGAGRVAKDDTFLLEGVKMLRSPVRTPCA